MQADRPLVVHVAYRFDTGGLENGIVNLINHMPEQRYRHGVVAITELTSFSGRIHRQGVLFHALHKRPGHGLHSYPQLLRLFRSWKPSIVHTRNLGALESQIPAALARVPVRVHGEHGRDLTDLDGSNRRHQFVRWACRPFVHHYLALSRDLGAYLQGPIGVPSARLSQIYNGVDIVRFAPPPQGERARIPGCPFGAAGEWIIGSVGRMQPVKNQALLATAFVRLVEQAPDQSSMLRLVMIGDGPVRAEAQAILRAAGVADLAWLPGERNDVADVIRGFDCFALPSLAEGISNTILEAMATGLPVVATDVGGNAELIVGGVTGTLVPSGDAESMASALLALVRDRAAAAAMGRAGRALVERRFSMEGMVAAYQALYDRLLSNGASNRPAYEPSGERSGG